LAELIVASQPWPDIRREMMKENIFGAFMAAQLRCIEDPVLAQQDGVLVSLYKILNTIHNNNRIRTAVVRLAPALFKLMDYEHGHTSSHAIKCLSLLPDSNRTWVNIMEQLIDALHLILHQVYVGFDEDKVFLDVGVLQEGEAPSVLRSTWQLTNVDEQYRRVSPAAAQRRIERLVALLVGMLSHSYGFGVSVPINQLMDVVDHLLVLDGSVLVRCRRSLALFSLACAEHMTDHELVSLACRNPSRWCKDWSPLRLLISLASFISKGMRCCERSSPRCVPP
jgi:hypothetical protein